MRASLAQSLSERTYVPSGALPEEALGRGTHLGLVAHADDLEILAYHGILTAYRDPSQAFVGIVVSDGAGSVRSGPFAELDAAGLVEQRRKEQMRAAEIGRYAAVTQLGHPSHELKQLCEGKIDEELFELVRLVRPKVLYTHSLFDRHATHLAVTLRVLRVLRQLAESERPERVLGVEVWGDLDWLPAGARVELPVSGEPELESALLGAFESQLSAKRYDLATVGRRLAHATFASSQRAEVTDRPLLAVDLGPVVSAPDFEPLAFAERWIDELKAETSARLQALLASESPEIRSDS